MRESTRNVLALETIDFQSGLFFKDLTLAFEGIMKLKAADFKDPDPKDPESPNVKLRAIIKHHTGMDVGIEIGQHWPCVEVPRVDRNHPLLSGLHRMYSESTTGLKLIEDAKAFPRGSVNLNTGRVSGVFEQTGAVIHLPIKMVSTGSKWTAEENAGILLHEVGHLFCYYEFISRSTRTNQALAGLTRQLDGTSTQKERAVVLLSVKEALRLKDLDVDEVSKTSNKEVVQAVVISAHMRQVRSELGSDVYDENNFEYLADQYAARQGAGRALITALDKFWKMGLGDIAVRSTPLYLFLEAIKVTVLIYDIAGVATFFFRSQVGASIVMLFYGKGGPLRLFLLSMFRNAGWLLMALDGLGTPSYDRPAVRVKRIRNQLVEAAKLKNDLPPLLAESLENDFAVVDAISEGIHDRVQVLDLLKRHLFGINAKRLNAEELQQQLEGLASNELFQKADELRAAAQ